MWSSTPRDLLVRIYRPPEAKTKSDGSPKLPAILDLHGGMWNYNDRTLDEVCNKALAEAGFLVAAIDFRQGPMHQHPAASKDAVDALHWLRHNSDRLNIDPDRIGILGSSSGGHLAMYAALTPNSRFHGSAAQVHVPPKFIVALWPVSDPYQRYRYATRAKLLRLVEAHDAYFVTEDGMREASVPRLVVAGEAETLPPLLVVQPGEDGNVPAEINLSLVKAYQDRGGYIEYGHFPGEPHAFGLKQSVATQRMIELVISFSNRFA